MNQEFSKNNELSYNLIKERYLKPLKINPDLFIGIELEFPIVHKQAHLSANFQQLTRTRRKKSLRK